MRRFARLSLGARLAVLFSVLLAAIGVFMLVFFPARMANQAQDDMEERAESLARIMAAGLEPAVQFEDPDNASSILQWLASTHDARFGLVQRADSTLLAVWHPDAVPTNHPWGRQEVVTSERGLMLVSMPIASTGGTLHLGFSLEHLVRERDQMRHAVALAVLVVVAAGVLATLLLAAYLLRPIGTLTKTALEISRGELPPQLPVVAGANEIMQLAQALRAMLERIHEVSQAELIQASRQAGMAEVATGILHNVGNVLTAVNVTVAVLRERIDALPLERITRLRDLLGAALAADTVDTVRVANAVKYLDVLADALDKTRSKTTTDLSALQGHVDHIKRVVAMQNAYARLRSAAEPTRIADVVTEAIEISFPAHRRGTIALDVSIDSSLTATSVMVDRHRIMQILVNLVSNARDAVQAQTGAQRIAIAADRRGGDLRIRVADTGIGIEPDLAARIFGAGVTSKANGHGYGLHSSAMAARQMNGTLDCSSEGKGHGATFTLTVPIEEQS